MSIKTSENSEKELCSEYFSYFNYKLYDSPFLSQNAKINIKSEINYQSTIEESLINDGQNNNGLNIEDKFIPLNLLDLSPMKDNFSNNIEKSPNKDIKPELHKFILPKSLFSSVKNKNNSFEKENANVINKSSTINENINTNDNINNNININNINDFPNNDISSEENSLLKNLNLLSQPYIPKNKILSSVFINSNNYLLNAKADKLKKNKGDKKKKKNTFVKRKGDWICYKCKNLNFAFRNFCNKCKLSKEESDKQVFDIGKELMKLAAFQFVISLSS